jgi:pimeloyl-ACP methyl ester carboxylesterase/DNA-binding CsgD family transcriptional regulator
MRPTIRYCTSPAGRVAYSTAGHGPALLVESGWVTDLRHQPELFEYGRFLTELAQRFTVIRFDKPGCGLSSRDATDFSFQAQIAAALAVADAAGAQTFSMFGASQGGQLAAAIAAGHPGRVSRLVVYGMCANGADLAPAELRDSLVALVRAHWGLGSKMMTSIFVDNPGAADVAALNQFQRVSASAAAASGLLEEYYRTDIRGLLPQIRTPTTVLHREADTAARFELGREVASLIPAAELIPLPGAGHLFYQGEWQASLAAILAALGEPDSAGAVLTERELEVARLIAAGLTNHAIATRMSIAPRTAESHAENIRRKLGVRSRAQIAAWVAAGGDRSGQ